MKKSLVLGAGQIQAMLGNLRITVKSFGIKEQEESEENSPIPLETQSPFHNIAHPITLKNKEDGDDFQLTFPDEVPSDYIDEEIQNPFSNKFGIGLLHQV